MALLVFDIGGSAVKYGIWDNESLHAQDKFPTPLTRQEFYTKAKSVLDEFAEMYEITGVGVSCPGETDEETGKVKGWSFVPFLAFGEFQQSFSEAMDNLPVSMMNDANAAGLAEMTYGVGKGHSHPLFLIIGSGIGTAFVEDGKIVIDAQKKVNPLKQFITAGLQFLHAINVSPVQMAKVVSVKKLSAIDSIEGKDVFELAKQGDAVAKDQVDKLYQSLAELIAYMQVSFQPEFFAIGGGLSNEPNLLENLQAAIDTYMKTDNPVFTLYKNNELGEDYEMENPIVKICKYNNDANLIGAALHFYEVYND